MDSLNLRTVTAADAAEFTAMAHALAAEEGGRSSFHEAAFLQIFTGPNPCCQAWIAERSGEIAGFIQGYPGYDLATAATGWHLGDLYVKPSYRRRGIATRLVAHLAEHCRQHDGAWLSWTVLTSNEAALSFYRQLGAIHRRDVAFLALGLA